MYRQIGVDRPLTYDDFFSIWLNTEAGDRITNFNVAVAVTVGLGGSRMPKDWIDAAVRGKAGQQQWKNWDVMRTL